MRYGFFFFQFSGQISQIISEVNSLLEFLVFWMRTSLIDSGIWALGSPLVAQVGEVQELWNYDVVGESISPGKGGWLWDFKVSCSFCLELTVPDVSPMLPASLPLGFYSSRTISSNELFLLLCFFGHGILPQQLKSNQCKTFLSTSWHSWCFYCFDKIPITKGTWGWMGLLYLLCLESKSVIIQTSQHRH